MSSSDGTTETRSATGWRSHTRSVSPAPPQFVAQHGNERDATKSYEAGRRSSQLVPLTPFELARRQLRAAVDEYLADSWVGLKALRAHRAEAAHEAVAAWGTERYDSLLVHHRLVSALIEYAEQRV